MSFGLLGTDSVGLALGFRGTGRASSGHYLRVMMIAVVVVAVMVVRMMRIQDADVRLALLQVAGVRRFHDRLRLQNDRSLVVGGRGLVCVDRLGLVLVGQADGQHTEQTDYVQQDQLVHFG